MAAEVPLEEQGAPALYQHQTQPCFLGPERQVPMTFGWKKKQWGLWLSEMVDCWSHRQFLLKGLYVDLLVTLSELQGWGCSLKGSRNIWGGTESSGIRKRAMGREAVFWAPHKEPVWGSTVSESPSTRLKLVIPSDSLRPHPNQPEDPHKLLPVAFPYEWPVLANASDLSQIS